MLIIGRCLNLQQVKCLEYEYTSLLGDARDTARNCLVINFNNVQIIYCKNNFYYEYKNVNLMLIKLIEFM
jgi:hypothetical protein